MTKIVNFNQELIKLQEQLLRESEMNEGWKEIAAGLGLSAAALGYNQMYHQNRTPEPAPIAAPAVTAPATSTKATPARQLPQKKAELPAQKLNKDDLSKVRSNPVFHALEKEAINSGIKGHELAQLLAQAHHETGGFTKMTEQGDSKYFRKYDPKYNPSKAKELGNTRPGEGSLFRGRGHLQFTGKWMYDKLADVLGLPVKEKPFLLTNPEVSAKATVWYWQNRVQPRVSDFRDVAAVTKTINPKLKGLEERNKLYQYYKQFYTRNH